MSGARAPPQLNLSAFPLSGIGHPREGKKMKPPLGASRGEGAAGGVFPTWDPEVQSNVSSVVQSSER